MSQTQRLQGGAPCMAQVASAIELLAHMASRFMNEGHRMAHALSRAVVAPNEQWCTKSQKNLKISRNLSICWQGLIADWPLEEEEL